MTAIDGITTQRRAPALVAAPRPAQDDTTAIVATVAVVGVAALAAAGVALLTHHGSAATASRTPGRWFHAESPHKQDLILAKGMHIRTGSDDAYGDGIYFASRPDRSYGSAVVAADVNSSAPLVIHERKFLDIANFQRTIRPIVDRYVARVPAARTEPASALTRAALRDAGYDSILITRRPWESRWLVALEESDVKAVTREA